MRYLRALAVGALLSVLICAYSAYAGLRMGGVYWSMTTASLVALVLLKALGNTDKNEINILQTTANTGAMVAAGIIFTIPAATMLGLSITVPQIIAVALLGGLAGVLFSMPLRKELVGKLPYPDGAAAAALINAGDEGGKKARMLFASFGASAAFAIARFLGTVPAALSVIPIAGGYLIGPLMMAAWFGGALVSKLLVAQEMATPLGVGIVIGAAVAYFVTKGLPAIAKIRISGRTGLFAVVAVGLLSIATGMDLLVSGLAMLGAAAMSYVGARVTGETNVDPMEIFAMIVLLAAKFLLGANALPLVLLAAVVCLAAGLAGDLMQDLKTGFLLGTDANEQLKAQVVGVVAAAAAIGFILVALDAQYGIGSAALPAPQAVAVREIVGASSIPQTMMLGALAGAVLCVALGSFGLGAVLFGIGIYVSFELSLFLAAGALVRMLATEKRVERGRVIAAGLISGEGIVGVAVALAGLGGLL
ncbi:hypothetical protein COT29_02925 [Candidatus Micrarchaeota archaeon CG08_land_8_20_14_0_20_59_11]|nr:MAG: hypothetical protein COT29_02925 [Candidatus Micrarchaeota archaeon CG08_land_8_20_14_0_20_59_11]